MTDMGKIVPGYLYAKSLREDDPVEDEHRVWFEHRELAGCRDLIASVVESFHWQIVDSSPVVRVTCVAKLSDDLQLAIRLSRLQGDALGRAHSRVEAFLLDGDGGAAVRGGIAKLDPSPAEAGFALSSADPAESPCAAVREVEVAETRLTVVGDDRQYVFSCAPQRAAPRQEAARSAKSSVRPAVAERGWHGWELLTFLLAILTVVAVGYALYLRFELAYVRGTVSP